MKLSELLEGSKAKKTITKSKYQASEDFKKDLIITKKDVIHLIENILLHGQRVNIQNNSGKLFITKVVELKYNYKNPSGHFDELTFKEVKKWILCGKEKYKIVGLPSGINSFAYELVKLV